MKKLLILSIILSGIMVQPSLFCAEEIKQKHLVKQSVIKRFAGKAREPLANLAILAATSFTSYCLPREFGYTHVGLEIVKTCIAFNMLFESHQNLSSGETVALNSLIISTILASLSSSCSKFPRGENPFLSDYLLIWTAGLDLWESIWKVKPCIENALKNWSNS